MGFTYIINYIFIIYNPFNWFTFTCTSIFLEQHIVYNTCVLVRNTIFLLACNTYFHFLKKKFQLIHFWGLWSTNSSILSCNSQNHRLTTLLRLKGTSGHYLVQIPCSKQGHLKQVVQDHIQSSFEYLHKWRLLAVVDGCQFRKFYSYLLIETD